MARWLSCCSRVNSRSRLLRLICYLYVRQAGSLTGLVGEFNVGTNGKRQAGG